MEGVFDTKSIWPLAAPVQPGNTLILAFIPTLGESNILSVVDDQGNAYIHDMSSGSAHFYHLSNITNAPTTITATADLPLDTRLYAWEVSGMGANPVMLDSSITPFPDGEAASVSLLTDGPAFLVALVNRKPDSPSTSPVADGGATLHRLLQLANGEPYVGPVSEYALHRIDTAGGNRVIGSSWVGQGNSSGIVAGVAYRPGP
jgi:hypothetical protein